jgi:hypothetical protein
MMLCASDLIVNALSYEILRSVDAKWHAANAGILSSGVPAEL